MHNAENVITAKAGATTTAVLKSDGTVWVVGLGTNGQMGDNGILTRTELVQTTNKEHTGPLTGIVNISASANAVIALQKDKTALVWGINTNGQLGNNSTTRTQFPIPLAGPNNTGIMENIVSIETAPISIYVELEDGTVYGAGLNSTGQLSLGNVTATIKVFTEVKDENKTDALINILPLGRSKGTTYGFATDDGTVKITGLGTSGQHANGTTASSNVVTKVGQEEIVFEKLYQIPVGGTEKVIPILNKGFNLNLNELETQITENLTFESLNTEIVTVSEDGTITGIKNGTAGVKVIDTARGIEGIAQIVVGERELSNIAKIASRR